MSHEAITHFVTVEADGEVSFHGRITELGIEVEVELVPSCEERSEPVEFSRAGWEVSVKGAWDAVDNALAQRVRKNRDRSTEILLDLSPMKPEVGDA